AVPGHVDHVVDATGDPVVAVRVAARAVAGEILAGELRELRLDEALVVAEHRAHLAGPAVEHNEVARRFALAATPLAADDARLHAEVGLRRGTGLLRDRAGQRRDQDAAGLGLPPRVDDRAAAVADDAVIPLPRLGIDRLADRAEQAQALP